MFCSGQIDLLYTDSTYYTGSALLSGLVRMWRRRTDTRVVRAHSCCALPLSVLRYQTRPTQHTLGARVQYHSQVITVSLTRPPTANHSNVHSQVNQVASGLTYLIGEQERELGELEREMNVPRIGILQHEELLGESRPPTSTSHFHPLIYRAINILTVFSVLSHLYPHTRSTHKPAHTAHTCHAHARAHRA